MMHILEMVVDNVNIETFADAKELAILSNQFLKSFKNLLSDVVLVEMYR